MTIRQTSPKRKQQNRYTNTHTHTHILSLQFFLLNPKKWDRRIAHSNVSTENRCTVKGYLECRVCLVTTTRTKYPCVVWWCVCMCVFSINVSTNDGICGLMFVFVSFFCFLFFFVYRFGNETKWNEILSWMSLKCGYLYEDHFHGRWLDGDDG